MKNISDLLSLTNENILINDPQSSITKLVLSNPQSKTNETKKIVFDLLNGKNGFYYQASFYFGAKVRHENISFADMNEKLSILLLEYKQCDFMSNSKTVQALINRKQQCNIKIKILEKPTLESHENLRKHNKSKNYIIEEGTPVEWLIQLGIMNESGKVFSEKQKKFRQINRFLEMVDDVKDKIPKQAYIIDVGCGKSYLTFALYHFLNVLNDSDVTIVGLDLKEDVVNYCQSLAEKFGFSKLSFIAQDIAKFQLDRANADMVVTLHACDTATDFALFNAVRWNSSVILSVPCCQHELYSQIDCKDMNILLKHGIIKERFSSLLTDSLRASLLESCGYKSIIMEFIDMDDTPKNLMIRAIKNKNINISDCDFTESEAIMKQFNIKIQKLYNLLNSD